MPSKIAVSDVCAASSSWVTTSSLARCAAAAIFSSRSLMRPGCWMFTSQSLHKALAGFEFELSLHDLCRREERLLHDLAEAGHLLDPERPDVLQQLQAVLLRHALVAGDLQQLADHLGLDVGREHGLRAVDQ